MSRSITTIWKNEADTVLTLCPKETKLDHGKWTNPAPAEIKANQTVRFEAENSFLDEIVQGTVVYRTPRNGLVSWQFDVPRVERSTFTVSYAGDVQAVRSGHKSGDKVTQTVTVTPQPQPHYNPTTPVMPQIKTVVHLMMENRSLDHVLGWLYKTGAPSHCYPGGFSSFDGASTDNVNPVNGQPHHPSVGNVGASHPLRVTGFDPNEPMPNVKIQLYGSANPSWSDEPNMSGFAADYASSDGITHPDQVMGSYDPDQLPVINGLAKNFAVSDRWFCSVPTQTDPNRAFSICGTSLGAEVNAEIDHTTYVDTTTIFNALGNNGKTWGMYWQSVSGTEPGVWKPFTSYFFPQLKGAPNGKVDTYNNFFGQLAAGTAPDFCYIEPYWGFGKGVVDDDNADFVGIQGNDYHPPTWMGPAEAFLNTLYEKLIGSKQWKNMLFIITFDEHGGTYDHFPPPTAVAPDGHVGKSGFDFKRLGVRVPTILVSPYIQPGTVFRAPPGSGEYDHTSVLATLLKWAGVEPSSAGLGLRTAQAPTFEGVLTDQRRMGTTPLPTFQVPPGYAEQGGGSGHIYHGDISAEDLEPAHWSDARRLLEEEGLSDEEFKRRFRKLFTREQLPGRVGWWRRALKWLLRVIGG